MARSDGSTNALVDQALTSPWWINHLDGGARRRPGAAHDPGRSRREFASIAAQLGLAAWMIGALVESSCVPALPRPTAAQVLGLSTVVSADDRPAPALAPAGLIDGRLSPAP